MKSATRLPSWDSHSTTDDRMGKRMGALAVQKSCLHRIKTGELRSTNFGVYGDGLATICAPNARNRRNAFDCWNSYSTIDGRNGRWTDLCQIHKEDVSSPSLGRVRMSRLKRNKVKVTTDKNALCTHNTPLCRRNETPSLQVTSRKQQLRRFDRCRGMSSPACVVHALGLESYRWVLPRISSWIFFSESITWRGMSILHELIWKGHIPVLLEARVTWSVMLVVMVAL